MYGACLLLLNRIKPSDDIRADFQQLCCEFYGTVADNAASGLNSRNPPVTTYFCGDFEDFQEKNGGRRDNLHVIRDFSYNYTHAENTVDLGQVPLNIHNMGILFKNYFQDKRDWFTTITAAHAFQSLTEGNKAGTSYRKGIYLSQVLPNEDALAFNLLRCSTNFSGPTEGLAQIDEVILSHVNSIATDFFDDAADLNHVLAQVYENSYRVNESGIMKQRKAKIKGHSDKTKDMPDNGLIAFCSFYSPDIAAKSKPSKLDSCNRVYKDCSVLSTLRFRLKECVTDRPDLVREFAVTLYPNSVFVIPLLTNRLYTHEVVPSTLPVDHLPTRLGYVARCSDVKAVHQGGHTFLTDGTRLRLPTDEEREHLKGLYYKENTTAEAIEYGELTYSLNEGDLMRPLVAPLVAA